MPDMLRIVVNSRLEQFLEIVSGEKSILEYGDRAVGTTMAMSHRDATLGAELKNRGEIAIDAHSRDLDSIGGYTPSELATYFSDIYDADGIDKSGLNDIYLICCEAGLRYGNDPCLAERFLNEMHKNGFANLKVHAFTNPETPTTLPEGERLSMSVSVTSHPGSSIDESTQAGDLSVLFSVGNQSLTLEENKLKKAMAELKELERMPGVHKEIESKNIEIKGYIKKIKQINEKIEADEADIELGVVRSVSHQDFKIAFNRPWNTFEHGEKTPYVSVAVATALDLLEKDLAANQFQLNKLKLGFCIKDRNGKIWDHTDITGINERIQRLKETIAFLEKNFNFNQEQIDYFLTNYTCSLKNANVFEPIDPNASSFVKEYLPLLKSRISEISKLLPDTERGNVQETSDVLTAQTILYRLLSSEMIATSPHDKRILQLELALAYLKKNNNLNMNQIREHLQQFRLSKSDDRPPKLNMEKRNNPAHSQFCLQVLPLLIQKSTFPETRPTLMEAARSIVAITETNHNESLDTHALDKFYPKTADVAIKMLQCHLATTKENSGERKYTLGAISYLKTSEGQQLNTLEEISRALQIQEFDKNGAKGSNYDQEYAGFCNMVQQQLPKWFAANTLQLSAQIAQLKNNILSAKEAIIAENKNVTIFSKLCDFLYKICNAIGRYADFVLEGSTDYKLEVLEEIAGKASRVEGIFSTSSPQNAIAKERSTTVSVKAPIRLGLFNSLDKELKEVIEELVHSDYNDHFKK